MKRAVSNKISNVIILKFKLIMINWGYGKHVKTGNIEIEETSCQKQSNVLSHSLEQVVEIGKK